MMLQMKVINNSNLHFQILQLQIGHNKDDCVNQPFVYGLLIILIYIDLKMKQEAMILGDKLYPVGQQSIGKYPYRLIGAIISRSNNGQQALGTGILISRRIVLTAAHIIYSRRDKLQNAVEYKDIKFYKGAHKYGKSNNPHNGEYKRVIQTRFLSEHKNYGMKDEQAIGYDYGLLLLENDQSQSQEEQNQEQSHYKSIRLTPICKCHYCEDKIIMDQDKNVNIFGYPKGQGYDNARPIAGEKERFQFVQYESIRNHRKLEWFVSQGRIHYYVSTLGGQSGAPIFLGNYCIGIHLMGGNSNLLNGPNYNGGRLFTIDLLQQLLEWIKELEADIYKLSLRYNCFFIQKFIKFLSQKYSLSSDSKPEREQNTKQLSKIDHSFTDINEIENCSQKLLQLYLIENKISQINITQAKNLKHLDLQNNPLKTIDLKNNKKLLKLCLIKNEYGLKNIDVSENTQLTHLFLQENQLISIDLSKNIKLTEVDLRQNKLSDIDLRNNVQLESIYLNFNKIKKIDLSANKKLQQFGIISNCLDAIDLRKNTLLYVIGLQGNFLKNVQIFFNYNQFIQEKKVIRLRLDNQESQKCQIAIHYKLGGSIKKNAINQVEKMESEIKMKYQQNSKANKHHCFYKTYFIEENS